MRLGQGVHLDPVEFDRAYVAKHGLYGFVRRAWRHAVGSALIDTRLVQEIAVHAQAAARRECMRLVANLPPGTGKSLISQVFRPAWAWADERRTGQETSGWIFSSYSADLSNTMARACYELVRSKWYQERWPLRVLDSGATDFRVEGGGRRMATTVAAQATGFHADHFVIDDPLNAIKAGFTSTRTADLEKAGLYCKTVVPTRVAAKRGTIELWMQRLHPEDPSGALLDTGSYQHFCLPMHADPKRYCRTRWGGDWRTKPGELLCPERFSPEDVDRLAIDLGVYAPAQLEQWPSNPSGSIVRRDWLRWHGPGSLEPTPAIFDEELLSCDLTFSDGASSDNVCIQHWGRLGANFYLLHQLLEPMNFPRTVREFQLMCRQYPRAFVKLVENKANGPALLSTLERSIPGLVKTDPERDKSSRLNAVAGLYHAGNVYYLLSPWGLAHADNIVAFPWTKHDDDVDAESQALAYFVDHQSTWI